LNSSRESNKLFPIKSLGDFMAALASTSPLTPRSEAARVLKTMNADLEGVLSCAESTEDAATRMFALRATVESNRALGPEARRLITDTIGTYAKSMSTRAYWIGPAKDLIPALQTQLAALPSENQRLFPLQPLESSDSKAHA
jgi:hypothetical protein